jgi:hypothetical protein
MSGMFCPRLEFSLAVCAACRGLNHCNQSISGHIPGNMPGACSSAISLKVGGEYMCMYIKHLVYTRNCVYARYYRYDIAQGDPPLILILSLVLEWYLKILNIHI